MHEFYSPPEDSAAPDAAIRKPWLVTFANLVCILLSIFVLLAHSSRVQTERVEQAIKSLGSTLAFGSVIDPHRTVEESAGEALVGVGLSMRAQGDK